MAETGPSLSSDVSAVAAVEGLRLRKNKDGYRGETIPIKQVLSEIQSVAKEKGWETEVFAEIETLQLLALRRTTDAPRGRVYISAGIHGDEPAGPLAMRDLLRKDNWPKDIDVWLCPCLNPVGIALN